MIKISEPSAVNDLEGSNRAYKPFAITVQMPIRIYRNLFVVDTLEDYLVNYMGHLDYSVVDLLDADEIQFETETAPCTICFYILITSNQRYSPLLLYSIQSLNTYLKS